MQSYDDLLKYINMTSTCWLWTAGQTSNKYAYGNWNGKMFRIHRLMYELTYGKFDKSLEVCHKCDIPLCVNPKHLFLGTHKDNMDDMIRKGRLVKGNVAKGEQHYKAKLTNKQAEKIRWLYQTGNYSQSKLGNMFNLDQSNICRLLNNMRYNKKSLPARSIHEDSE